MARVGCICGNVLSNSDCPSKDVIYIYFRKDVDVAILTNPSITLWDFYSIDSPYVYFYCHNCGRVYKFNIKGTGEWWIFGKADSFEEQSLNSDWQEVYVFTDIEIDEITEENFTIGLAEFIKNTYKPYRFWYNSRRQILQAYESDKHSFAFTYILEEKGRR